MIGTTIVIIFFASPALRIAGLVLKGDWKEILDMVILALTAIAGLVVIGIVFTASSMTVNGAAFMSIMWWLRAAMALDLFFNLFGLIKKLIKPPLRGDKSTERVERWEILGDYSWRGLELSIALLLTAHIALMGFEGEK